jgi:RNA polymerase sigma-70 factor (ECF subfamily)
VETTLRARLRAGDQHAFGDLFDDYARAVYNHAFRLTADWSVAQDVVSLTFLEAWRLRERLEPDGGSPLPWLLGIATNVARNTTRAGRRHRAAIRRLAATESIPDFTDDVAQRLDDAKRLAAVQLVLRRLRRPEREVVALCVWAGLDYAAAAAALRIPIGTVRSRLSRARARLRALAEEELARVREPLLDGGQVSGGRHKAARPTGKAQR